MKQAIQGETAVPPLSPRLTYNDTWAIIYTSGTTGHPKGAQVTYGNFFYNAIGMGQAIQLTADDVNLNVLPTFHIGGLGLYAGPTLHAGGTVVIMRAFDPAQFMALVQQYQVSVLLLVPAIYLMLNQYARF
jgi:fatty-acyl-CoA synthase